MNHGADAPVPTFAEPIHDRDHNPAPCPGLAAPRRWDSATAALHLPAFIKVDPSNLVDAVLDVDELALTY
jgi:hypothetical protein